MLRRDRGIEERDKTKRGKWTVLRSKDLNGLKSRKKENGINRGNQDGPGKVNF